MKNSTHLKGNIKEVGEKNQMQKVKPVLVRVNQFSSGPHPPDSFTDFIYFSLWNTGESHSRVEVGVQSGGHREQVTLLLLMRKLGILMPVFTCFFRINRA